MIKEKWQQILQGIDIRQNLSGIRKAVKDRNNLKQFLNLINGEEEKLILLLESDDEKIRKNAALLMGDLGKHEFLEPVWRAYLNEQQRSVKSFYLASIGNFDYREYLGDIKNQLEGVRRSEMPEDDQNYVMEEMRKLSALIVRMEGVSTHKFTGWNETHNIILMTNRNFTETIKDELLALVPNAKTKMLGAGIMARVDNLNWIRDIRTYRELLFVVRGMESCRMDPVQIAQTVIKSGLTDYISNNHSGIAPYYFRLEMRNKMDSDQKSLFLKTLSSKIETLSNRRLIYSTSNYEFELRLIENKQGDCNIMVKLLTLTDTRFSYRKEVVPASIKPVNAALTVALAREYMKEEANVLDPFCGVGTMLIERHKALRVYSAYGIDIREEAIVKARENTAAANQTIHFTIRNFFYFSHEYPFDEIITNMPYRVAGVTEAEIVEIYERFFEAVPKLLKKEALLVLYSHDRELMEQMITGPQFHLLKECEISKREGTCVFVIKYQALYRAGKGKDYESNNQKER